jgi:transcriptional regulator with XRE-family HTH domain
MKIKLSVVLKRELSGLKLSDVAKETGIPISLLSDWKEGSLPSGKNISKLLVLAEYFSLNLEQLIFDIREKKSSSIVLQTTRFRDGEAEYRISIEKLKQE